MIELHPKIIEKDGKKQFVVLTYEEFLAIEEALADAEDLSELRAAKKEEHDAQRGSLENQRSEISATTKSKVQRKVSGEQSIARESKVGK